MTHRIDWDRAYREESPAWNIGEPQPEFAALIDRDAAVRGEVLDAGCGCAELSLALAERGHTVVGLDLAPTAVRAATEAAAARGLGSATFAVADISAFTGYDGRFATIFDSGLLHALPEGLRDGYLRSVHRAAAPGASFYILAFAAGAFPEHMQPAPAQFTAAELRELVSTCWQVEEIRPARLIAAEGASHVELPGHLVIARKG